MAAAGLEPAIDMRTAVDCFSPFFVTLDSDRTASLSPVKNNVYPAPRDRYFTLPSVCPAFASNVKGALPKLLAMGRTAAKVDTHVAAAAMLETQAYRLVTVSPSRTPKILSKCETER